VAPQPFNVEHRATCQQAQQRQQRVRASVLALFDLGSGHAMMAAAANPVPGPLMRPTVSNSTTIPINDITTEKLRG